jgi:hypothetical protein
VFEAAEECFHRAEAGWKILPIEWCNHDLPNRSMGV